jgi:sarcosine oxidase
MYGRHVEGRLRGVLARVVDAKACLYTVTPDAGFIVDQAPGMDRVMVVSACSGHGFKHSAALGEAIAEQIADGRSRIPLDTFALSRLGKTTRPDGFRTPRQQCVL